MHHALPSDVKRRARNAYRAFRIDTKQRGLDFKPIKHGIWSVRIDDNYRALGLVEDGEVTWGWIGPHNEYMRQIRML